jgi:hypothetical protein
MGGSKTMRAWCELAVARCSAVFGAMRDWMRVCSDYHAAASVYEELSRLSEAELRRRGLSRDTLARDVCDACGSRPRK